MSKDVSTVLSQMDGLGQ